MEHDLEKVEVEEDKTYKTIFQTLLNIARQTFSLPQYSSFLLEKNTWKFLWGSSIWANTQPVLDTTPVAGSPWVMLQTMSLISFESIGLTLFYSIKQINP